MTVRHSIGDGVYVNSKHAVLKRFVVEIRIDAKGTKYILAPEQKNPPFTVLYREDEIYDTLEEAVEARHG